MYEDITYEVILQRMINRVLQQNPNIDTREGSIIFNALAPAAVELTNMYIQLDTILNETFADTASRDYLIQRAAERGLAPYPATSAILKGEFNIDIPIGSRFSYEQLNYIAAEKISMGVFKMQCETIGAVGNDNFGTLIPIEYIDGLTSAQLTELLIPAENEEDTEHFRQRYYNSLNAEAFGGNIEDYREKVDALSGVGGVKVYPIWNGGGTVKLVIIASDYSVPTPDLIESVQTAIDPTANSGEGVGIAPIGHVVTVAGVSSLTVNIKTEITYQEGWTWEDVKPYAEEAVDAYFKELGGTWASNEALIVRISQIEIRFLDLPGVVDIADTTLNGLAQNLALGADEIPVRGNMSD
jgi:uncharacterized phage protein gp47/JayE